MEILQRTGFRTYSEFVDETTAEERVLLVESIAAYHEEREGAGGGAGTLPGGEPAGI